MNSIGSSGSRQIAPARGGTTVCNQRNAATTGHEVSSTGILYPLVRALIRAAGKLVWPVKVTGLENVSAAGPVIIAPNHISFLDSVVLIGVLPRRITYLGKAEYMDSWKTRHLFPAMGMIPIDRSSGKASFAALDTAASVLEEGKLFGIFPEGTRSRDGHLHRGRTGIARLALRTGAPVIPVGIRGTDRIQPPGASVPRLFRGCEVSFGPPIPVEHYRNRSRDPGVYRDLTDEIMYTICQLSGQIYLDRYADRPVSPAPVIRPPAEGSVAPRLLSPATYEPL
jgi:1-acyl-sn-glycerol-3-phosphate acyltransferase